MADPLHISNLVADPSDISNSMAEPSDICNHRFMSEPSGFRYEARANGEVVITHHERVATVLRGGKASRFLDDVARSDEQELMARVTGNYKRGNERRAQNHTRNRGRR